MYRSLWIAALVSNVGTFMHIVAAGWAMTSLTVSPTLVGLVQTSWAVPGFVLALHAGAFADMVERRRLIAITQVLALGIAATLGVLEMTGNLGVTTLLVGTFLESVALTIAAPAFMALTPQLVGTQYLSQAFGLDSVSRNIAQSVGPALAGAVIAFTSPGAVFVLNAVSFVGILIVVRKLPKFTVQVESASKINHVIKDGIKHVVRTAQLRNIALRLALVLGATASLNSVMPVVAKESLNVGSGGFGILAGALGVGSVLAVWLLPILRKKLNAELLAVATTFVWAGAAVGFAQSSSLLTAVPALLLCGATLMVLMNVLFSTFIAQLPDHLRGRGSSIGMLMAWLGTSVGAFAWGFTASSTSVRVALIASAAVTAGIGVLNRVALPLGAETN
jgi:predicted MFS family arabinose efflux permease